VLLYPQLRRAEVYSLTGAKEGPWRSSLTLLEAGFPQQPGQLEKQFEILGTASEGTNTIVRLKPKSREARRWVTGVRVTLADESLALQATELEFADGSQLRNDFRNSRINPEVLAHQLTASIPSEYTVAHPSE
jgi:hypothetical protein